MTYEGMEVAEGQAADWLGNRLSGGDFSEAERQRKRTATTRLLAAKTRGDGETSGMPRTKSLTHRGIVDMA